MLLGRSLKETIPHFKPANGGGWISAVLAPGCGGTGHSLNYGIILFLFFKIGLFVENKYVTFELHNSFLSVIFLFERRGGAREKRDPGRGRGWAVISSWDQERQSDELPHLHNVLTSG